MTTASDCPFCKIVRGEIPAQVVFATDDALAFLDINPLADGHTLVVPKQHYPMLTDMPADELQRMIALFPKLGAAVLSATGAAGFNLLQNNGRVAGQVVPHVHFHIIPRAAGDGLGYRWNTQSFDRARADVLREAMQAALAG